MAIEMLACFASKSAGIIRIVRRQFELSHVLLAAALDIAYASRNKRSDLCPWQTSKVASSEEV